MKQLRVRGCGQGPKDCDLVVLGLGLSLFWSVAQYLNQSEEAKRRQMLQGRRSKADWTARPASCSMFYSFSCLLFLKNNNKKALPFSGLLCIQRWRECPSNASNQKEVYMALIQMRSLDFFFQCFIFLGNASFFQKSASKFGFGGSLGSACSF